MTRFTGFGRGAAAVKGEAGSAAVPAASATEGAVGDAATPGDETAVDAEAGGGGAAAE